jgi:hypothetical protein
MTTKPKIKVVVFDVDETLGNFSQFSIFAHAIEEYFNKTDITYQYFNDLVDLYPEIIRPSMLRILEYIRKKKNSIPGSKVMIYTNNMGPDKWVAHIRNYFEYKLRASAATASATNGGLAIIPPLFDHTIGGFKPQNAALASAASASAFPQRTTKEKTFNELIRCARLPSDTEICFLDDVYHPKMADERVYYIKLQAYHSYIPFHTFVARFLNSALYRDVFDKFPVPSIRPGTTSVVKKQILTIEINDLFVKYANMAEYDAKVNQRKMFPREIDEIISKYILYHLQQFFRDGPPPITAAYSRKSAKTAKKNRVSSASSPNNNNVFYVNKSTAVKNIRNKTARNR